MKDFFRRIFEYHHHYNQRLAEQLEEHMDKLPERTGSLFGHTIFAHGVWNARINGEALPELNESNRPAALMAEDTANFEATLEILNKRDLDERMAYQNSEGLEFENSIADILFHISNHTTHHRGQLISDIRQAGVPPVVTDYIFFRR